MRRDQSKAGSDYRREHNAQMWKEREHIVVPLPRACKGPSNSKGD
jgi:hypothetical protein